MAAVLGLIIGVVIGVFVRPDIPIELQPYLPIMVLAVAILLLFSTCLASARAAAYRANLLVNSELRDNGAGWALGEYGAVDGKVTREGYPSVKLSVAKAKNPVDARVSQALPAGAPIFRQ